MRSSFSPIAMGQPETSLGVPQALDRPLPTPAKAEHPNPAPEANRAAKAIPVGAGRLHESVLDQLSVPVLVLDAAALLRYANRAARELLADGGPVRLVEGQVLGAAVGNERLPLELVCRCRAARTVQRGLLGDATLPQGYWVKVSRLGVTLDTPGTQSGVFFLMQLTAPWRQLPWDFTMISQSFDLTVAEAQLVSALADGMSVEDFAGYAQSSLDEVRQRLRTALNKTGLRAQAELIQVMGRVSPLAALTTPDLAANGTQEPWGSGFT